MLFADLKGTGYKVSNHRVVTPRPWRIGLNTITQRLDSLLAIEICIEPLAPMVPCRTLIIVTHSQFPSGLVE